MNNSNGAHDIPREVKNNIKRMAMEQELYAQVFKLCRKDLKLVATYKNKKKPYETRKKVNTTKWRPIYEFIDEAYINHSKIVSDDFIK